MGLLTDTEVAARVDRLELPFNRDGVDPYGICKRDLVAWYSRLRLLYRRYFDVSVHGIHHVPARGRAMLVGNHSGGVALDAMIVCGSMLFEAEPPRLVQAMAEKFLARTPWGGTISTRLGHLTGLPEHAERLLRDDRLLLVFPEGARGTAKLYGERNSLVRFGTGFVRLALQTGTPIVPFAFVGGGDAIPTVRNLYGLGKLFGLPYLPVTPWLLPVPRPAPLAVHYSAPIRFEGTGREDDEVVLGYVEQVKRKIAELIEAHA